MYKVSWCEKNECFSFFKYFKDITDAAKFAEEISKDFVIEIKYENSDNNRSTLWSKERFTTLS